MFLKAKCVYVSIEKSPFQEPSCCGSGQFVPGQYDHNRGCFRSCSRCARPLGFPCGSLESGFLPCMNGSECVQSDIMPELDFISKHFKITHFCCVNECFSYFAT